MVMPQKTVSAKRVKRRGRLFVFFRDVNGRFLGQTKFSSKSTVEKERKKFVRKKAVAKRKQKKQAAKQKREAPNHTFFRAFLKIDDHIWEKMKGVGSPPFVYITFQFKHEKGLSFFINLINQENHFGDFSLIPRNREHTKKKYRGYITYIIHKSGDDNKVVKSVRWNDGDLTKNGRPL